MCISSRRSILCRMARAMLAASDRRSSALSSLPIILCWRRTLARPSVICRSALARCLCAAARSMKHLSRPSSRFSNSAAARHPNKYSIATCGDTTRDRQAFRRQCPDPHQWGRLDHGKYQLDPKTLSLANAAFTQARASSFKASFSCSLLAFEARCRASSANS